MSAKRAADTLRWWSQAGVDFAVGETPHDRFANPSPDEERVGRAEGSNPNQTNAGRFESTSHRRSAVAGSPGATDAQALAAAAVDLDSLQLILQGFDGCSLKRTATQLVFADGVPGSRLMLVGEAPGGDEDRIGRPFVGRAGQLLDRMLGAIGLDRRQVYIANVVPWRPPGNRTPTPVETQICLPFIRRQIELANPELLVCLGGSAAQTLLGLKGGIMRARGSWFTYENPGGASIPALAMLHPAYLLRQPAHKRLAWLDLRTLARALAP